LNDISAISGFNDSAIIESSPLFDPMGQSPEPMRTVSKYGNKNKKIMLDIISDEEDEPTIEDIVDDDVYHKQVLDIMAETDSRLNDLQL
jgi:hypothetical protein